MKKRLALFAASSLAIILAIVAAAASNSKAADGGLTVVGPWSGNDARSFQAVLAGFTAKNPGVTVTYKTATGDVATTLGATSAADSPDLAVLTLPKDQTEMSALATSGRLSSLDFLAPAIKANYAFAWKQLGSVDGHLVGLFFKATNRSAFWYDQKLFRALGLTAPTSWAGLKETVAKVKAHGLAPFAISGASGITLPGLFSNLYLTFQGPARYDKLASGTMKWTDPSVMQTLSLLKRFLSGSIAGGPAAAMKATYATAVQEVFGSPAKAYMVPGGSAAYPVLYSAKAVRPLSQFGAFAFPATNAKAPARVIGDADAVVMTRDSAGARALLSYLATPEAAAIWAGQGGDFLSPNRSVSSKAYAVPQMAMLAAPLAGTNAFRYPLADTASLPLAQTLNTQLEKLITGTATAGDVASRLVLKANVKS